jgi:hypothetical protein
MRSSIENPNSSTTKLKQIIGIEEPKVKTIFQSQQTNGNTSNSSVEKRQDEVNQTSNKMNSQGKSKKVYLDFSSLGVNDLPSHSRDSSSTNGQRPSESHHEGRMNHGKSSDRGNISRDNGNRYRESGGLNRDQQQGPSRSQGHRNRDMDPQTQMKNMIASGAIREQGIVVTVKGEFGFLKPADRPDEIYFRIQDLVPSTNDKGVSRTSVREVCDSSPELNNKEK